MRFSRVYLSEQPRRILREAGFSDYGIYRVLRKGKKFSPYYKKKALQTFALVKMKEKGISIDEGVQVYSEKRGHYDEIGKVTAKMVRYARELIRLNRSKQGKTPFSEVLSSVLKCMAKKQWTVQDVDRYMRFRRTVSYDNWTYYKNFKKKYGGHTFNEAMEIKSLRDIGAGPENYPKWYK
jgi:hypothetical protein